VGTQNKRKTTVPVSWCLIDRVLNRPPDCFKAECRPEGSFSALYLYYILRLFQLLCFVSTDQFIQDDHSNLNMYRVITLTPIISKLFEFVLL